LTKFLKLYEVILNIYTMPFENLNNSHYTAVEKTAVETASSSLETALTPKFKNITAEERKKYSSVNEQNKLIVNKVRDYNDSAPALSSPDVDWVEFQADFESREFIQKTMLRLESMLTNLDNNKILHDWDNYGASLTDYGFSQYKAGTKVAGFETKVNEIGQFFSRTGTATTPTDETPTT
jgi:hypothetical protein